MSYNDIDGEQEAERPVVFRRKGKSRTRLFSIAQIIILWVSLFYAAYCIDTSFEALSLQAEQTGISAARDTQRIKDLVEYGDCYKCHPRRERKTTDWYIEVMR